MDTKNQKDSEHITILCVFHYVICGLCFAALLFLGVHYYIMQSVLSFDAASPSAGSNPPPEELLTVFMLGYGVMGLVLIVLGIINFLSARFMKRRKNRIFSLVVAGINCLNMPAGTTLGVFTIIALLRESVQLDYKQKAGL
ncbi:MAG: hypothetical protein ACPG32_01430 [Akkermansiaceae bacterium]